MSDNDSISTEHKIDDNQSIQSDDDNSSHSDELAVNPSHSDNNNDIDENIVDDKHNHDDIQLSKPNNDESKDADNTSKESQSIDTHNDEPKESQCTVNESEANNVDNDNHDNNNDNDNDGELADLLEKLVLLEMLQRLKQKQEEEWKPTFDFKAEYIGNGFINITVIAANSPIGQFEIKYAFYDQFDDDHKVKDNEKDNEKEMEKDKDDESLSFETVQFGPKKMKENSFLIRIPQRIYDYIFIFHFRALAQKPRHIMNNNEPPIREWTEYSDEQRIFIPFDSPTYQFKVGENVLFQCPDSDDKFWTHGKIIKFGDDNMADILYSRSERNSDDKEEEITYQINVDNLKCEERERTKLIDLTDWNDIYQNLMLNGKPNDIQQTYFTLNDILSVNLRVWIYGDEQEETFNEDQVNWISLVFFGDIDQDIKCCSRFLALNIVKFLDEDYEINHKHNHNMYNICNPNNYDIVNNNLSIGCGLCPIRDHYRNPTKVRNLWHSKLIMHREYARNKGGKMRINYIGALLNGWSIMCDICAIGFHHMSYLFLCDSVLDEQHDICLPCMNRNILQFKRLQDIFNDLYHIHGLDHYCVSQIVYCLVGWVHLNK